LYLVCIGCVSVNAAFVLASNGACVSCVQHTADFGPPAFTYNVTNRPLILIDNVCDATHDLTGKLVLTQLGCSKPTSMALRAQQLGAVAIVIANNENVPAWGFIMKKNDVVPDPVLIPTVSIGKTCRTMIQQMIHEWKNTPTVHFTISISGYDAQEYVIGSTGIRPPRAVSSSSSSTASHHPRREHRIRNGNDTDIEWTQVQDDTDTSSGSTGFLNPTVIWCTVVAALLIFGVIAGVCWRRHHNHKRDAIGSDVEPGTNTSNTAALLPYTPLPVCTA